MQKKTHELIRLKPHYLARCKIILLVLIGFTVSSTDAQSLFVREMNNNQTSYSISNLEKVTFSSGDLIIKKTNGIINQYPISGIRYVNFEDLLIGISDLDSFSDDISIYPNPVNNNLKFNFPEINQEKINILIVDIQGKIYISNDMTSMNNTSINVSELSKGLYFCIINTNNNRIVKKFIKN